MRRMLAIILIVTLLLGGAIFADWWIAVAPTKNAQFVGGASCIRCHQEQFQKWRNSHHDLAMQVATPETVLGDFNDALLTHHDTESRMFRRNGKYFINTEGPDGAMRDFVIKYCFGVDPMQQYMVEFDRNEDLEQNALARLQVLRVTWDTHNKKWFYLPPPDVPEKLDPTDDLHWTGIGQRWNTMCADCHSTNLQKNFDTKSLTYATTFTDIDVNCEACHGPGSIHVELATATSLFWDRRRGYGLPDLKSEHDSESEIQSCVPCHSRRHVFAESYPAGARYHDYYGLEVPSDMTYFADGQILDEVYEYGSYLQSKMYHQKVRCSDCHDPHSTELKFANNQVCTSCHQHPAGRYDSPSHHQHRPGSTGSACVECHMPSTVYMEIDARRDHSFRVPRPDLSAAHGLPNACTACHLERAQLPDEKRAQLKQYRDWVLAAREDHAIAAELRKVDRWAAEHIEQWFPDSKYRSGEPHFGELLLGAWRGQPNTTQHLLNLVNRRSYPAVMRAAAWQWLMQDPGPDVLVAAEKSLRDPSPLVRAAAVRAFERMIPSLPQLAGISSTDQIEIEARLRLLFEPIFTLLSDPVRLVRMNAANVLSHIPPELLPAVSTGSQRQQLEAALAELVSSWQLLNDRADGHRAMALLYENQGRLKEAIAAYRTAIRVQPHEVGARSNLAMLLEQQAENSGSSAERLRREAEQLRKAELPLLARDARLAPKTPEVQYRYGMALYLDGQHEAALAALRRAYDVRPDIPDYSLALATLHQQLGNSKEALQYAEGLVRLAPQEESYRRLLEDIRKMNR